MAVIAYDKPVADFISQLNATTHVTNVAYRKKSVTFHHNGGRLSLQGILDVWKVRAASAHFQVDGQARVGQYVKVNEYAWATGNTQGNKETISIELANATLAPGWTVASATWKEGARLCGWLHAKVLGVRPTRTTVRIHGDWKATECPGPYIRSILNSIIAESQKWYDYFKGKSTSAPKPATTTAPRTTSSSAVPTLSAAEVAKLSTDHIYSRTVKYVGPLVDQVLRGVWGNNPERSKKLLAAGWSPTVVQDGVERRLGRTASKAAIRPSNAVLAQQVLDGKWGDGPERERRLTAAGYNYDAVQAEVNKLL